MREEIFDKNLSRFKLLKLKEKDNNRLFRVMVYRNHSFEMVASVINKFLDFSDLRAEFNYSDYDDSLSFSENYGADINLIWLDLSRYKNIDIENWIKERLEYLQTITKTKTLVYCVNGDSLNHLKIYNTVIADTNFIKNELKEEYLDISKLEYSGTLLSNKACLYIARVLGLKYIPSMLFPAIKAIVTDLDNTFYTGILGEDGIDKIIPHGGYQKKLKQLKEKGTMLAICSKNELSDVIDLFKKRTDFELKLEDFAAYAVSWKSKEEGIREIVAKLNIGYDSVLFIDDNIGEVEWIKSQIPDIATLIADDNTAYKLDLYPKLYKSFTFKEDSIRTVDIKANRIRENLYTQDENEYFKKLQMVITYSVNPEDKKTRIVELANKTNQFIFAYKRYSSAEIESYFLNKNKAVLTIELQDKLSDSGVIGILTAENIDGNLVVDELCVSCRALGRHIEDYMLWRGVIIIKEYLGCADCVLFNFKSGDRNMPAKLWLEKYANKTIAEQEYVKIKPVEKLKENDYIKVIIK